MHDYDYRRDLDIGRVGFEMSLKPFKSLEPDHVEAVCRRLFTEWLPLTRYASAVSVMLWTADGSEILEYTGDLDMKFSWCCLIGIGNSSEEVITDFDHLNLHKKPVPYMRNIHDFTYRDLKNVISAIKKVGKEITGFDIEVVETFDPGPEFARSDFKFKRHSEIAKGSIAGKNNWVYCASRLHAEDHAYAAFPNGIEEGTPFGTFLGRQFMAMKKDVGFDRIWLSNGFGFSLSSWNCCGEVFDGEKFDFAGAAEVRRNITDFWKYFSAEVGDTIIETRGSNLSAAMDISAHGCPVDDIYKNNMIAPPNSPWAALNFRFGLELCGYLSRIASLPKNGFLFRYYIHDPWWQNSPWFDRYGGKPHDLYLPLSLARLDENGKNTHPEAIYLLSCDDSFGNMPERCPIEVIPHILRAYNDMPTSCGPVTWLYPFETYCKIGLRDGHPDRIFMDDWLIESAIDFGFPLSSVISDENFEKADPKLFENTVLVTAVPEEDSLLEKCVLRAIENGVRVILYGNTRYASEKIRNIIGVKLGDEIEGKFKIKQNVVLDKFEKNDLSDVLLHSALESDGGLCEVSADTDVLATAMRGDGEARIYMTENKEKKVVWLRGSFPHRTRVSDSLPERIKASEAFPPASLLRAALAKHGLSVAYEALSADNDIPLVTLSQNDDTYFMTTHAKDMNVKIKMTTPLGAPICTGLDAIVENCTSETVSQKWQHEEIRLFVRQKERSSIRTRYEAPGGAMWSDRRYSLDGLIDATITIRLPEPFLALVCQDYEWWDHYEPVENVKYSEDGRFATLEHISGKIYISYQRKASRDEYRDLGYFMRDGKNLL